MIRDDELTLEERQVQDAIRRLPVLAADPSFRAAVRDRFRGAARRRAPWPRWALAATLLLVGVAGLLRLNAGAPWRVLATAGEGMITIDGAAVDVRDRANLERRVRPGARVTAGGTAELSLVSDGALVLVVTAGSEATLPAVPGRWLGRTVRATLAAGELRGVTGPAWAGARLAVAMPAAIAEVTGTTFAAIQSDEGSCVCVLDGRVTLAARGGAAALVAPGRRRVVATGGAARDEGLRPMERMKLLMLRDQAAALLGGARP